MENNEFIFKMNGMTMAYGDRTILRDVNLVVRPGEFWFLLGPNGVGKTTLLKALLGMHQPKQGRLQLHPEFAQGNFIGFVPQRCDLNPTLPTTVKEFVLLGLAGILARKEEEIERLRWALEKMKLEEMIEKNYWSLSGGQRQRALVARALIRRPKFLIVDEPTKDLDLTAANALMESLTDLNRKENLTILFVTHDLTLAAHYGTHIALFLDGSVRGAPCHTILNQENLERAYGVPVSIWEEPSGALNVRIDGTGGRTGGLR
jgi:ABC-type Mn2+/Zn2+ transport system ATPase subunit